MKKNIQQKWKITYNKIRKEYTTKMKNKLQQKWKRIYNKNEK